MSAKLKQNPIDAHGKDWADWIATNAGAGCLPSDMFRDMLQSKVWFEGEAIEALEAAFGKKIDQLGCPTISSETNIRVNGRTIRVSMRFDNPSVCLLDGVLSDEECDAVIEIAKKVGLEKSGVVDFQSGDSIKHTARSSTGTYFLRGSDPLLGKIEARLAKLTNWPQTCAEGLQLLNYEVGQEYRPHHDWFDPKNVGGAKHLERGGQRLATTIVYLKTPDKGGATTFPDVGLQIAPRKGSAVFFRNITRQHEPDEATLHAGAPVIKGSKVILTYWQREREFV